MRNCRNFFSAHLLFGALALVAVLGFQNCGGKNVTVVDSPSILSDVSGGNGEGYSGLQGGDTYYRYAAKFQTSGAVADLAADGQIQMTSSGYKYVSQDGSEHSIPSNEISTPQGTNGGVIMYHQGLYYLSKEQPDTSNPGMRVSLGLCTPSLLSPIGSDYSADIGVYSNGLLTVQLTRGHTLFPLLFRSPTNSEIIFESPALRTSTTPALEFLGSNIDVKMTVSSLNRYLDGQMQFTVSGVSRQENIVCTIDRSLLKP